jgi:HEAT repeat protein
LGVGFLGAWGTELRAEAFSSTLDRFAGVDWQRYAVMTKAPGAEPPWRLRLEAEYEAARAGDRAVDKLLGYTTHDSPHVRGFAAQMLGVIGEPASSERLRTLAAKDPAALVRNYAVEALSRLSSAADDSTIPASIATARSDPNPNVVFSAQQAELRLRKRVPGGAALRAEWTRGFDPQRLVTARAGDPAPPFTLTADNGHPARLADYRAKHHVVLLFQLADW